jgi:hypothetical protein
MEIPERATDSGGMGREGGLFGITEFTNTKFVSCNAGAERLGIFSPPTNVLTVANSVYAAKGLRDIVAHGGPWQE